jgi:hypothetical protein
MNVLSRPCHESFLFAPPKPARTNWFGFRTGAGRRGVAEKAHMHGPLKDATIHEAAEDLPEGYTEAAKVMAEKQAAMAGYRLAEEIGKRVR